MSIINKSDKYRIKEIFYSIQGEGYHSGKPAVFIRFSGCNLWSGKESDRSKAICKFCDTDFVGTDGENGGVYSTESLKELLLDLTAKTNCKYVVLTGGEPLLQVDATLIKMFKSNNFYISVETNGTIKVPEGIDWITVSPKAGAKLMQKSGNELKLVFPQNGINPQDYENFDFDHFYLQPKDEYENDTNMNRTLEFCLNNPKWKISVQLHKILGLK